MQVQNVQRAGFIAAVIHNIYADSLVRMHGTASKQQTNVQFCKTKQYLEICFYCIGSLFNASELAYSS